MLRVTDDFNVVHEAAIVAKPVLVKQRDLEKAINALQNLVKDNPEAKEKLETISNYIAWRK